MGPLKPFVRLSSLFLKHLILLLLLIWGIWWYDSCSLRRTRSNRACSGRRIGATGEIHWYIRILIVSPQFLIIQILIKWLIYRLDRIAIILVVACGQRHASLITRLDIRKCWRVSCGSIVSTVDTAVWICVPWWRIDCANLIHLILIIVNLIFVT